MKKKSRKRLFLVTIRVVTPSWDYQPNQEIIVPVYTSTAYHADLKIWNEFCGSEYPEWDIIKIEKCDNFLFKPIL